MNQINVYSEGPLCLSVCAPHDMSADEVERQANAARPTGIASTWSISKDKTFARGEPMPLDRSCGRHWLLDC